MSSNLLLILPAADTSDDTVSVQRRRLVCRNNPSLLSLRLGAGGSRADITDHRILRPLDNGKVSLRRIMAVFHPRRFRVNAAVCNKQSPIHPDFTSQCLLKHLQRNISRAQDYRNLLRKIHDRRFQADPHRAAVQDHIHRVPQIFFHMGSHGGAGSSGSIGAWRSDKSSRGADQRLRHRIAWKTDCHAVKTSRGFPGNDIRLRKDHSQRPRPVFLRKDPGFLRNLRHNFTKLVQLRDMNNQRIVRGPSLGRVYFHGCHWIKSVSSQSVNRLCGERHEAASFQDLPRSFYRRPVRADPVYSYNFCFHSVCFLSFSGRSLPNVNPLGFNEIIQLLQPVLSPGL